MNTTSPSEKLNMLTCDSLYPEDRALTDRMAVLFKCLSAEEAEGASIADFLTRYREDVDAEAVRLIELTVGVEAPFITKEILDHSSLLSFVRVIAWTPNRPAYPPEQARRILEVIVRPIPVLMPRVMGGRLKDTDSSQVMRVIAYSLLREARYIVTQAVHGVVQHDRCDFIAEIMLQRAKDDYIDIHLGNWREIALMLVAVHF